MDMDRIYLAGFDAGATVALELLLEAPELFAGAISLGGTIPSTECYGSKFRQLSAKKVLLGWGRKDHVLDPKSFQEQTSRLEQTGVLIDTRLYDCGHEMTADMLKEIDHWLMAGCSSAFV
jgi:phospholipase/carboxylesterase